uniref:Metalloprotease n=1 Tax=Argas monolakensis TaxID=34602 RepID=Q09JI7_ARGMO|nr:metalloprotease [Argas monolakensis]
MISIVVLALLLGTRTEGLSFTPASGDFVLDVAVMYDTAYVGRLNATANVSGDIEDLFAEVKKTLQRLCHPTVYLELRNVTKLHSGRLLALTGKYPKVIISNMTAENMYRRFGARTPGADVVLLMSGYELWNGYTAYKDGDAHPKQFCKGTQYAVISASGTREENIFAVTRFFGRLLGSKYDEQHDRKYARCRPHPGYAMSDYPRDGKPTGYGFTPCSLGDIQKNLRAIQDRYPRCFAPSSSGNLLPI